MSHRGLGGGYERTHFYLIHLIPAEYSLELLVFFFICILLSFLLKVGGGSRVVVLVGGSRAIKIILHE